MCGAHTCNIQVPYGFDNTTYGNPNGANIADPTQRMLDWILMDLDKIVNYEAQIFAIHQDEDKELHIIAQELNHTK